MRLHLLSLAHTEMTSEYIGCAYTQKTMRFAKMMTDKGFEVVLYSSEHNEAQVTEHVPIITRAEQDEILGPHDLTAMYDPDWYGPAWKLANQRAADELRKRITPRDFICSTAGLAHQSVTDQFPTNLTVETGIGYEGTYAKFRVFESYAWMHYLAGNQENDNVSWCDAVIPNFYDPNDFPLGDHLGQYLLWIGRYIERKGPGIAETIAQEAKLPLVLAGQGFDGSWNKGKVNHIGPVNATQRAELMGQARAVIVPTTYLGPFEGVAVEAMMCGTPIITTDWGAFTEYNIEGKTGYRFRTLGEAVNAVNACQYLDHGAIQQYARNNFSMERVGDQYAAYFAQLYDLWNEGWYSKRSIPGRYDRHLI